MPSPKWLRFSSNAIVCDFNVKSRDYKSAEKALKSSVDDCISHIEKKGGEGLFHRELPKAS